MRWILFAALLVILGLSARVSWAITPENPRVRSAVKQAIHFLESTKDSRLGAKSLVGLTFAKFGEKKSHPKIAEAIRAIQAALAKGPDKFNADIYSTGISVMFLVAVHPSRYRYEIEALVKSLHMRQKSHGAWGYPLTHKTSGKTCDTSMTQYAVLGLWEAEELAGVETPRLVWDRVARWLLLTQDPSGGFGYQGNPAARLGRYNKQSGVRHSMTVAALGSLYIVKDRVGITSLKKRSYDNTPDALQPYESPERRAERIKTRIDLRHFAIALSDGNRWVEDKYKVDELTSWIYYSLYALERYESLREAAAAGSAEPLEKTDKSKWYNLGARYLLRTQEADGSWESQAGPIPDTCFGALFLMGSTRQTLATAGVMRYDAGLLVAGHGIPRSKALRVRDGRVVVQPLKAPLDQVLQIVRDPKQTDFAAAVEALADASSTSEPDQLQRYVSVLSQLALSGPHEVRLLAVRCLHRTKNLDSVPVLIRLVGDRDPDVAYEAAKALGRISRKFTTFSMGPRSSDDVRDRAVEQWKAWYRTIRPDVDIESFDVGEASR